VFITVCDILQKKIEPFVYWPTPLTLVVVPFWDWRDSPGSTTTQKEADMANSSNAQSPNADTTIEIDAKAQQIIENIATGIGGSIWWNFSGTRITPDQLRQRMEDAGLDAGLVKDIDPQRMIRQCVSDFKAWEQVDVPAGFDSDGNKVNKTVKKKVRANLLHKGDEEYIIGILHHTQSSKSQAGGEQRDTMVWNLDQQTWTTPGTTVYADKIRADVDDAQTYLRGNTVRDCVVMPMFKSTGSVCIKSGWYYLPTSQTDRLQQAQNCLRGIESFQLHVAALKEGMGWEAPVAEQCQTTLTNELEALMAQIGGWQEMSSRVGRDTRQLVMDRFDDLHSRAESYEAALSITLEDLRDKIGEIRQNAADVIEMKDQIADGTYVAPEAEAAEDVEDTQEADQYTEVIEKIQNDAGYARDMWEMFMPADRPMPDQISGSEAVELVTAMMELAA